ncbi:MAG: DUF4124 domain-containing protein [Gammaproteobacteria bacterium]|jgi:hypothetical protein|nr:DUF4124 domain-containing protein [Gammaproteobacteria bacterium]MBT3723333.1 DUF4124 domain-containing protein [Gammaproteobacteria bacterium]MBT4078780.1 DUF4124 domain-containing protein [Gammaproteobacteria bacterium]MBT4194524.1 DUF4124 domain-containing protein [Gammaproteobacteria bacterium]MBT4449761.1 DUF4124 domain-containing protein [Gammaproteobacteria bacterium]
MKRFLIPVIFIACNSYAAGIQKWVDENGNIHYGDTPPAQTKSQTINVSRPPSNPGKPLPRFSDGSEKTPEMTDDKAAQKKNSEEDKISNNEICEQAKIDLNIISRSNTLRIKQKDGTERTLSDKEIDERRKKTESDIKQYCK